MESAGRTAWSHTRSLSVIIDLSSIVSGLGGPFQHRADTSCTTLARAAERPELSVHLDAQTARSSQRGRGGPWFEPAGATVSVLARASGQVSGGGEVREGWSADPDGDPGVVEHQAGFVVDQAGLEVEG